jgi:hypoxanthine-DNA glycosylase
MAAGQYYAMPRNAFWSVMAQLCGAGPELDYSARLDRLMAAGIALWDVLHAAERPGSLDAAIVTASEQANDIAGLVRQHRSIRVIAFNGKTAAALFRRHVAATLPRDDLDFISLPSTSPAHAAMDRETKIRHWHRALMPHLRAA